MTLSTPRKNTQSPARLAIFWAILILVVVVTIEAGSFLAVRLLVSSSAKIFLWDPNLDAARRSWKANATAVDDELGWPSPSASISGTRDASGAKINFDFPDPKQACMSAYGDSFVWGDDVPPADGWIEQLSRRLGCRVSNFGVSGYGTDQAYLRFSNTTNDRAPVVVLGIFPDDIVRTVNQYRAFIGFGLEPFWLKGRFVLDAHGNLQWIARPSLNEASFVELHRKPAQFLPHEYFLPNSHDGQITVRFPYTMVLVRLAMMPRLWNRIRGQTPWSDFYDPKHPSGAVPLTIAIAKAFARETQRRGARPFVIMEPGAGSFRSFERTGKADYAPFVTAMAENGISVYDPMSDLKKALKEQSYCKLFVDQRACQGHYSIFGGGILAEVVAAQLQHQNLLSGVVNPALNSQRAD